MTAKKTPGRLHVPPSRASKNRKKRTNSEKLKSLWKDPERRAQMITKIKAGRARQTADRLANPDKYKRTGTPNGMTRETAAPLWAEAKRKADKFMQKMVEEGIVTDISGLVPDSDEAKGVAALHEACVLALGPSDKQLKLAAIRTVLEYTKSKPESKSKMTISSSEEWLAQIAALDHDGSK